MEKADYLPTHDHFYSWISSKEKQFLDIFDQVHGSGNGNWLSTFLDKEDIDFRYEFEKSPFNDRTGYWDIYGRLSGGHGRSYSEKKIFVEYKTSLEESNVEEIVRKIKKRHKDARAYDIMINSSCLVTFDKRFSKFRSIFENESISLIVLSDAKRRKIGKEFGEIDDGSEDLKGFLD